MTLWLIFAGIGVFFLLFLIIAVIFDGVLDVFDFGGDGVLSMTSIGGAGAGFGAGGALSVALFGADMSLAILAGGVGALALGFATMKLASAMKGLEHKSESPDTKIGRIGYSLGTMTAGNAFDFIIEHNGVRKKTYAISDEDVVSGEALEVTAILSSTRLKVKKPSNADNGSNEVIENNGTPAQITSNVDGVSAEDFDVLMDKEIDKDTTKE